MTLTIMYDITNHSYKLSITINSPMTTQHVSHHNVWHYRPLLQSVNHNQLTNDKPTRTSMTPTIMWHYRPLLQTVNHNQLTNDKPTRTSMTPTMTYGMSNVEPAHSGASIVAIPIKLLRIPWPSPKERKQVIVNVNENIKKWMDR